jgi:hypothetical protein
MCGQNQKSRGENIMKTTTKKHIFSSLRAVMVFEAPFHTLSRIVDFAQCKNTGEPQGGELQRKLRRPLTWRRLHLAIWVQVAVAWTHLHDGPLPKGHACM